MNTASPYYQSPEVYRKAHSQRWADSLRWLRAYVSPKPERILEVGGVTEFSDMLRGQYESSHIENTHHDVRESDWGHEEDSFDLVLCMEVIEHLADIEEVTSMGIPEGNFYGNGITACLKECHSILKPGGYILVTTPNLNSIAHLASLIYMGQVYAWAPHVYEMSFYKAIEFVREAGFDIIKAGTEDPWVDQKTPLEQQRRADAYTMLKSMGADMTNRGEATFIIGRK